MKFKSLAQLAGVSAMLWRASDAAHACSVCITDASDPTAEAFNASVLFLLTTPYLVVGSIAGVLYLVYKRAVKKDQEQSSEAMMHLTLNQEESGR